MIVETVPVFGDNYAYLVICEETGHAAAIDPAEPGPVLQRAEALAVRVVAVWNTHHHADHTAGNRELAGRLRVQVVGHSRDEGRIPALSLGVEHGDTVELGNLRATVLHTPGHTLGAVCYLIDDVLFTGDTLFGAGCGRLFEGDPATMYRSLDGVIRPLQPQVQIYCGHEYTAKNLTFATGVEPGNPAIGPRLEQARSAQAEDRPTVPFTLAEELQTNPFLRCDSPEIQDTVRQRFPDEELDPVRVFTRVRQMRDVF